MKIKRRSKELKKLNLIPILDAVFIFIFFLLMSAQFLEIYEIGSDAPAVKMVDNQEKNKKEPLNLTLEIEKQELKVRTGLDSNVVATIGRNENGYDLEKLKSILVKLKKDNGTENSIVFRPSSDVSYKEIVKLMDVARKLEDNEQTIEVKQKSGQIIATRKLFEQIIFETII